MLSDNYPAFVWLADELDVVNRNAFATFLRTLKLPTRPVEARLHLFADTRYRLRVNGAIIGYGPARFYPSRTEYDSYDLTPHLTAGSAEIEVEVWAARSVNFQSVAAPAVFWAEGVVGFEDGTELSLSTPGNWLGAAVTSVDSEAIPLSFAIGPVEIRDLRVAQEQTPRPVKVVESSHEFPRPQTIPAMVCRWREPQLLRYVGAGTDGNEWRVGCFRRYPETPNSFERELRQNSLFHLCVYTPEDQQINVGTHWGSHFLNGQKLEPRDNATLGNRQDLTLDLRAGWNFFAGSFLVPSEIAGALLGFPKGQGLELRADPSHDAPEAISTRVVLLGEDIDTACATLSQGPINRSGADWVVVPTDSARRAPARQVAWDRLCDAFSPRPFSSGETIEVVAGKDGLAIVTLDFGSEIFGRLQLAIEAADEVTVDATFDEFLRDDNRVHLYRALWLLHSTDRYLCPSGTNVLEGFHNRGGRYVQLNLRTSPGMRLRLSRIGIHEWKTPATECGDFTCDNDFWNWIWQTSRVTLDASLEDVWSDSPWREQGCYLGDSLIQFHAHACVSEDPRIPARILRLFAESQRADGQICGVAPAAMTRAHPDFSLLYVRFLRDYWAASGDRELIRELWPVVERLLNGPSWIEGAHGLIRTESGPVFIDWSVEAEAREDFSSVVNALFFDALQCAAELAGILDLPATGYRERATKLRAAIQANLWDESAGRFHCTLLQDGTVVAGRALHGNTICWLRGLADPDQQERLIPWLLQELEGNAEKIITCRTAQTGVPKKTSGQLEYYFLYYLFEALAAAGRIEDIIPLTENMWGLMRKAGATTFWESVLQSYFNEGSHCHSWAVAPMIALIRHFVGYQPTQPGKPELVEIRPRRGLLKHFRVVLPHPSGPITAEWNDHGEFCELTVEHAPGATVSCPLPIGLPPEHYRIEVRSANASALV